MEFPVNFLSLLAAVDYSGWFATEVAVISLVPTVSISWYLPWFEVALEESSQFMVNEIRDEHLEKVILAHQQASMLQAQGLRGAIVTSAVTTHSADRTE